MAYFRHSRGKALETKLSVCRGAAGDGERKGKRYKDIDYKGGREGKWAKKRNNNPK